MPYWNSEKKRGDHKRRYVVKLSGNEFIPNAQYMQYLQSEGARAAKTGPKNPWIAIKNFMERLICLARLITIWELTPTWKLAFQDFTSRFSLFANILFLRMGKPYTACTKWIWHIFIPLEMTCYPKESVNCLAASPNLRRWNFSARQASWRAGKKYLAFDTTSVSSYSGLIKQVKCGKNISSFPHLVIFCKTAAYHILWRFFFRPPSFKSCMHIS